MGQSGSFGRWTAWACPEACDRSFKRLNTDVNHLYHQHRVNPLVPIEETVRAMARLVEQGKVRFLGISAAGPDTIRRGRTTHPVVALDVGIETEILPLCGERGKSYVNYVPVGWRFLTGDPVIGRSC